MAHNIPTPDPLERIADALEALNATLEGIDESLKLLSDSFEDCRVKYRYGSAISITGSINQI